MRIKIDEEEYKILCSALSIAKAEDKEDWYKYYCVLDKLHNAKSYSESNKIPRGILQRKKQQQQK